MKISPWLLTTVLLIVASILDLIIFRQDYSLYTISSTLLLWLLVIGVGVNGIIGFTGHFFRADEVAEKIGWPTGNPFQREIAFANLGYGVAGLLCFFFRDGFWLAVIVVYSVFAFGAGIGHIHETKTAGNVSEYNTGAVVAHDLLMPVILFVLYWVVIFSRG